MVYVLNINGQPLMPTQRHGKVRRLLKAEKAKVIKQLLWCTVLDCTIKCVGMAMSALSSDEEVQDVWT